MRARFSSKAKPKKRSTFFPQVVRFLVIFGLTWGVLHSLTIIFPGALQRLCVFHARITSVVISILGGSSGSQGTLIFFPKSVPVVNVIPECTGVFAMNVLAAAIVAFPATFLAKGVGIGVGALLIFVLNIIRLLVMLVVIRYLPRYEELLHDYLWQFIFIGFIVLTMKTWTDWAGKVEKKSELSG
ncbi:MAG: hypothetical protein QME66_01980 [Candidatus Eisenbacteria bacterium]|nr:hypothetical protein [Candidatus Eisenbacteria bacterium]